MQKNYFLYVALAFLFLSTLNGFSQNTVPNNSKKETIEGLAIFPNPVQGNKSYVNITSRKNRQLTVVVYNVLGKQISKAVAIRKVLDISDLSSGVYILKISEGTVSETRKLVIK